MPHRLIRDFQPYFSKKNSDLVATPDSEAFIGDTIEHAYHYFKKQNKVLGDVSHLNLHLLATAAASACIDVNSSTLIHDMNDGASIDKKAAAVCCWLNRLKPVQLSKGVSIEGCAYFNAHLALLVGVSWLLPKEDYIGCKLESMYESGKLNHLLYTLVWRNPSYKELTTLFQFLKY